MIVPGIDMLKKHWGLMIASGLAALQTMLLWYLNFGHCLFPPSMQ